MTTLTFATGVDDWVKAQEDRMLAVFMESTQRLVSLINNMVPVDTGFARASVRVSFVEMPLINPNAHPPSTKKGAAKPTYPEHDFAAEISGANLNRPIYVGWTAAYIVALEYGHSKQAPAGFVRIGCAQWPNIVDQVVREAKAI